MDQMIVTNPDIVIRNVMNLDTRELRPCASGPAARRRRRVLSRAISASGSSVTK